MKNALFVCLLFMTANSFAQKQPDLKLWYNKPAGNVWEDALPVGNGFQGAMVYGNVETETVQLNEYTVWSGSPNRNKAKIEGDKVIVSSDNVTNQFYVDRQVNLNLYSKEGLPASPFRTDDF